MEHKFKYAEFLKKNKLKVSDLPEDAREGIADIEKVMKGITLQEKKAEKAGKVYKVRADVMKKIGRLDKWVYGEIVDYVNDTNNNEELEVDADEIVQEIKNEDPIVETEKPKEEAPTDPIVETPPAEPIKVPEVEKTPDPVVETDEQKHIATGKKVNTELKDLFDKGILELTLENLKSSAKVTYGIIFDTYEKGQVNGVGTLEYSLKEKEGQEQVFILTKK